MSTEPRKEDRRSPARDTSPAVPARRGPLWRGMPGPVAGFITTGWSAVWILAFATGHPDIGLPLLFLTGPIAALGGGSRRRRRQQFFAPFARPAAPQAAPPPGRRPADWANRYTAPQSSPVPQAPTPPPSAERSLAATIVR